MRPLLLALFAALAVACPRTTSAPPAAAATNGAAPARPDATAVLSVTENGFEPGRLVVEKGRPLKLVVTRKTDKTCATAIVIKAAKVRAELPLNQPVTLSFTPAESGEIHYTCGMQMIEGVMEVR